MTNVYWAFWKMSESFTSVIATIDGQEYKTTTTCRYVGGEKYETFSTLGWELRDLRRGWGEYQSLTALHYRNNGILKVIERVDKKIDAKVKKLESANTKIQKLESDIVRYERMVQELRERVQMLEMKQEYEQQRSFENWFEETHSFELPE